MCVSFPWPYPPSFSVTVSLPFPTPLLSFLPHAKPSPSCAEAPFEWPKVNPNLVCTQPLRKCQQRRNFENISFLKSRRTNARPPKFCLEDLRISEFGIACDGALTLSRNCLEDNRFRATSRTPCLEEGFRSRAMNYVSDMVRGCWAASPVSCCSPGLGILLWLLRHLYFLAAHLFPRSTQAGDIDQGHRDASHVATGL